TIFEIGGGIHAGAIAELHVASAAAGARGEALALDAGDSALPAVTRIADRVDANDLAPEPRLGTLEDAGPLLADVVLAADLAATAAVLGIRIGIHADALAFGHFLGAGAASLLADASFLAGLAAGPAVVGVRAGIHAGAIAEL